jgi:hypothetical protein
VGILESINTIGFAMAEKAKIINEEKISRVEYDSCRTILKVQKDAQMRFTIQKVNIVSQIANS